MAGERSQRVAGLGASIEEDYQYGHDTPSSVYFEAAQIAVGGMDSFDGLVYLLSDDVAEVDARAIVREAKAALVSRLATRAAYQDFSTGTDTELDKLVGKAQQALGKPRKQ